MTDQATDGPSLEKLIGQFEQAFESTTDERRDSETCRDYYDGKQLTPDELAALAKRKQPPVISNRIKPKIDALLGFEKKQRTDPKAYPRTPQHQQDADSVTDAVRFVCDQNRFPMVRSEAAENLFIEGIGACVVGVAQKAGKLDATINGVPWDRYYRDPHSRKRDFSDGQYHGVVLWMDDEDAKGYAAKGVDADAVIADCYASTEDGTFEDRPKCPWSDTKRKRIRVLQHRFRHKGQWWTAIFCKGGFLSPPQVSPFVDEEGVPVCDLIATSAYVDRENRRYGAVKGMISPQDEINKRRSKALHLLNTKQIIADKGAVDDIEQARAEAARPDGYMEPNPGMRFDIVEQGALVAGQFELLQESKNEIDASGVNPALEGDIKAPSGRAAEIHTAAGLAEQAIAFEALKDWSFRVYKAVWQRVRQYWTDERWIRVTDDQRNLRWVQVNAPGRAPLSELEIDLILEDGPDSITIQSEQFDKLVELKKADPMAIQTKHIIQASDLRNKDEILKDMEQGGIPPQVQQQMQEMQQALQQCQQQLQQAEMAKGQEKAECNAIKAQVSADIKVAQAQLAKEQAELAQAKAEWQLEQLMQGHDLRIRAFEAQTDRIQALQPDQPKEN